MMMRWEGFVPVTTAVAALALLLVLPQDPEPEPIETAGVRDAGQFALEHGESGAAVIWDDGGSGLAGMLTPLKVFRNAEGEWCRHYVLRVDGAEAVSRTACREADGQWRLQDAEPQVAATR